MLNFTFPTTGNAQADLVLRNFEAPFDNPSLTRETRGFFKVEEQLGRHRLSQEVNYTNGVVKEFLPLSQADSLPSRRNDTSGAQPAPRFCRHRAVRRSRQIHGF